MPYEPKNLSGSTEIGLAFYTSLIEQEGLPLSIEERALLARRLTDQFLNVMSVSETEFAAWYYSRFPLTKGGDL